MWCRKIGWMTFSFQDCHVLERSLLSTCRQHPCLSTPPLPSEDVWRFIQCLSNCWAFSAIVLPLMYEFIGHLLLNTFIEWGFGWSGDASQPHHLGNQSPLMQPLEPRPLDCLCVGTSVVGTRRSTLLIGLKLFFLVSSLSGEWSPNYYNYNQESTLAARGCSKILFQTPVHLCEVLNEFYELEQY